MKKLVFLFSCFLVSFAEVKFLPATPSNIDKFEQIIDVRIPIERRELGIIKKAKVVEFSKDKDKLWNNITSVIDPSKPFAIICRSGRRSKFIADLIDTPDLDITILEGGIRSLVEEGYITTPYKK